MRHLATDKTADLRCLRLHVKRLKIMRGADEIGFRIEFECLRCKTVEEPTTAEDGELTIVRELGERRHERLEVGIARSACSLHEVVSLADVSIERIERIDIVERCQRVEPQDMAVEELAAFDQVTDDTCLIRNDNAVCCLSSDRGSVGVGNRANTADTLNDVCSVFRSTILDYEFHATEATTGDPSVRNNAILDFHLDAKVTFDTSYGIDDRTCHY